MEYDRPPNSSIILDLEGKTEEELHDMKTEVETAITSMKLQIAEAKAAGEYADRDWWRRVNAALKIKGRQAQQLQNAIGKLNRARKERNTQRPLSSFFMSVAKEKLSYELYEEIYRLARDLKVEHDEQPGM